MRNPDITNQVIHSKEKDQKMEKGMFYSTVKYMFTMGVFYLTSKAAGQAFDYVADKISNINK